MSAGILDGKALAGRIKEELRCKCGRLARAPRLAVVLVGDDPASAIYVRNKERDCRECGIDCRDHRLAADTTQEALLALIRELNRDDTVDGILVQLPLPGHLDGAQVLRSIDPAGKHCVVVGRSNIVGKPLALLLLQADATVTVCHSKTPDLADQCRRADILVSAAGQVGLITADMVRPHAVVIDVAMNRGADGRLCGDVDFGAVAQRADYITPVPGGVGPMTRAMLMENTYQAALGRESR